MAKHKIQIFAIGDAGDHGYRVVTEGGGKIIDAPEEAFYSEYAATTAARRAYPDLPLERPE